MAGFTQNEDDGVISGINVTPLVDITLVLLIVFIVTAKIIVGQTLPMDLPKAATGGEQQVVLAIELAKTGEIAVNGQKVENEESVKALWQQIPNLPMYFSFYFFMTGLHGSHVLVGMGLIAWVTYRTHKGEFGPKYYTPIECVGLFWHLVDLIWIYLFPLLYLIG